MMKSKFLTILACIVVFAQIVCAKGIGTTMFQILQMPATAYDAALANTTSVGEVSAISNPSLIPFLSRSIILSHSIYIEDTKYSVGDVNIPLSKNSGLNIGFCYFDMGKMDRYIEYGDGYTQDGSFDANDKVFNISYGTRIGESFSLGLTLKYISETIDDTSYSAYAGGLSGLFFLSNTTYINVGINNLGSDVKGYSLPTDIYCSLTGAINETAVGILQIDDYYNDELVEIKIATEKSFDDIFFIRLGYVIPNKSYGGTNNTFITNLTLGAGLKLKPFYVDYAWLPKGDLGNIHMFTVRVNF